MPPEFIINQPHGVLNCDCGASRKAECQCHRPPPATLVNRTLTGDDLRRIADDVDAGRVKDCVFLDPAATREVLANSTSAARPADLVRVWEPVEVSGGAPLAETPVLPEDLLHFGRGVVNAEAARHELLPEPAAIQFAGDHRSAHERRRAEQRAARAAEVKRRQQARPGRVVNESTRDLLVPPTLRFGG